MVNFKQSFENFRGFLRFLFQLEINSDSGCQVKMFSITKSWITQLERYFYNLLCLLRQLATLYSDNQKQATSSTSLFKRGVVKMCHNHILRTRETACLSSKVQTQKLWDKMLYIKFEISLISVWYGVSLALLNWPQRFPPGAGSCPEHTVRIKAFNKSQRLVKSFNYSQTQLWTWHHAKGGGCTEKHMSALWSHQEQATLLEQGFTLKTRWSASIQTDTCMVNSKSPAVNKLHNWTHSARTSLLLPWSVDDNNDNSSISVWELQHWHSCSNSGNFLTWAQSTLAFIIR